MRKATLFSTDDRSGEAFQAGTVFNRFVATGHDERDRPVVPQRFEDAALAVEAAANRDYNDAGILCIRGIYYSEQGPTVVGQVFVAEGVASLDVVNPYSDTAGSEQLTTLLVEQAAYRGVGADKVSVFEHSGQVLD